MPSDASPRPVSTVGCPAVGDARPVVSWVADDPVDGHRLPVELSAGLARAKDCAVPKLFTREVREGRFFTVMNDEYPVLEIGRASCRERV